MRVGAASCRLLRLRQIPVWRFTNTNHAPLPHPCLIRTQGWQAVRSCGCRYPCGTYKHQPYTPSRPCLIQTQGWQAICPHGRSRSPSGTYKHQPRTPTSPLLDTNTGVASYPPSRPQQIPEWRFTNTNHAPLPHPCLIQTQGWQAIRPHGRGRSPSGGGMSHRCS